MQIVYRDYQIETGYAVNTELRTLPSTLVVLPTGAGKSIVMRNLVETLPYKRVLVLVHKIELVNQLANTLSLIPQRSVVVEQASRFELTDAKDVDIAVCSIQTLQSRPDALDGVEFDLVIIDETHRAAADGYLELIEQLGCLKDDGPKLVGFTATAFRSDKQPLSMYRSVAIDRDLLWGIRNGWLVPIRAKRLYSKAVDAAGNIVSYIPEGNELYELVTKAIQENCYTDGKCSRPTIIMAHSVDQGREVAEHLRLIGLNAQMVDSMMDQKLRHQYVQDFKDGNLDILVGYQILVEGFDAPRASCMVWLRDTSNALTYVQGIGRIIRPVVDDIASYNQIVQAEERRKVISSSTKPDALLLDCSNTTQKQNLVTVAKLFGLHANFDFEGELITDVIDDIDDLIASYPALNSEALVAANQIGHVAEDIELWRQSTVPNVDVPDTAQLTYIKHRDHWLLIFPLKDVQKDVNVQHVIKITQDARGEWRAWLSAPNVWREWYYNGQQKRYMQKFYRGKADPDMTKTIRLAGKELPRYELVGGMPPNLIAQASIKVDIFSKVEAYIASNYSDSLWKLLDKDAVWRSRPVSPKVNKVLERMKKQGIALPDQVDSSTASIMVDQYFMGLLKPPKIKKGK